MSVGSELLNAPFPLIVRNLGVGIAEAQLELDLVSLRIARMMAGFPTAATKRKTARGPLQGRVQQRQVLQPAGAGLYPQFLPVCRHCD
ncbi:hypothetical protein ULF88_09470 [Halopseudomonas pachastrellae]|nr:hypothetical protein [Halopseudomonas pachastrellae]